ncbi:MAG TPA: agmatinase [Desulfomicrobiaceae bacterium]|nr:agmatinase [Desulfomicrobiaceae bacterium]
MHPYFLDSEIEQPRPEQALFHIICAPYEQTVSYGEGTGKGPAAIIEASQQLELFDGFSIPADEGIHTHPPLACTGSAEQVLEEIRDCTARVARLGKVPVLLGGEHTVTWGALKALQEIHGTFGVVQFDAHADLRDTYEGTPWSHACVMHRALDLGLSLFQVGVRSMSFPETEVRTRHGVKFVDGYELGTKGLPESLLPRNFPDKIYVTFDVDGLDPSVIPGTGTPEPGGLTWYQAMQALAESVAGRTVIGADVVELAPIAGEHVSDFAAARLVYNLLGMIQRNSKKNGNS